MWRVGTILLTFAAGVLAQSCGTTRDPSEGLADATVFPWVGLVYYVNDEFPEDRYGSAYAIGALIDKQHVLMSEYLAKSVKAEELYVQLGATDAKNIVTALNYTVDKIFVHPNALSALFSDMVILRLKDPVKFSEKSSPVCLPVKGQEYKADKYYYVSYNLNDYANDSVIPKQKNITLIPSVKATDCEDLYKKALSLINPANRDIFICAGGAGDQDSCHLDSTFSPLFSKTSAGWTIVGLYLFGPDECGTGLPGAFLSAKHYLEWIETVVAS